MSRRSTAVLAAALALGGCSGVKNLFSARADLAAEAGNFQLSADRVAQILSRSGGQPSPFAAEFVANLWLDYTLFAQAVAEHALKTDSTTVARVMWPQISQARVRMWHDTLLARQPQALEGKSDSVYQAGQVRVFQHLILVPAGPKAADTAKAQTGIQSAAAKLKAGGDFGKLAGELSADGSKSDSGFLPPGPRGQFVKAFEDVAWSLEPGQVSGVVQTQFGFHLIRRPTQEQARRRLLSWLREREANHKDSVYLAELSGKYELKLAAGAPQAMRAAASDLDGNRRSTRTVVSLKGGDVTVGDVVKWVSVYPPNVRLQIQRANDSLLGDFAKGLATSTLLLRQADSAGVKLQGPAWQFVQLQYTNAIDGLRADLGLSVPELSDSSRLSADQKAKLAHEKVEDYFNRLIEGRAQVRPLLPVLAAELRGSGRGRVNQAGLARAVELATAKVARDSAGRAAGPAPGVIQRAPGGPPIGGQSTPPPAPQPPPGSKKP